jgi:hypothetical protein
MEHEDDGVVPTLATNMDPLLDPTYWREEGLVNALRWVYR